MFNSNKASMKSQCGGVGSTADTDDQTGYIYNAIIEVSKASLVDPRYILATVMQESVGCVNVGSTNNGQTNPGIMQSANGTSFVGNSKSADEQQASVTQMVVDGTQGTPYGSGLVQGINIYGNIYECQAARYYNSGEVDKSDLNNKMGATASYVSDIANRMTGWVNANSKSCS
ncbi:hypothetical protein OIDMADRAFT_204668 [Oidiodendron maius Zn]|uniref:Transglycosylase SLT domain-containing protein n=1 Tax=Oidiodendron maius (strain Zn) TaxID=913774 RepID=A0A0C3GLB6_OIDMZ|nr:hypothetical protein OIDMADRAFT_204668 [Oidiodendron maius Zn]